MSTPAPHVSPAVLARALFEHASHPILLLDASGVIVSANPAACALLPRDGGPALIGTPLAHYLEAQSHDDDAFEPRLAAAWQGDTVDGVYLVHTPTASRFVKLEMRRLTDAAGWLLVELEDITTQRRAELVEQSHKKLLDLLAHGATLGVTLRTLVLEVERHAPDTLVSILLLDHEGQHLHNGAAPSLPDFYNAAIDGIAIGPGVGSCGTAAYSRQRVIVEDVATHPYWAPFCALTRRAGLGACWSEPIINASGRVLGTFAIYHRVPRAPTPQDIDLIERAAKLALFAIERSRDNEELRLAALVYQNCQEAIMVTDETTRILSVNPAFCQMTGYLDSEVLGQNPVPLLLPEEHRSARHASIDKAIHAGHGVTQMEIQLQRKNGESFPAELFINTIAEAADMPKRVVSMFLDLSTRKAAEKLIWRQANFDALTGLPNRYRFMDELHRALESAHCEGGRVALLFIDLDGFKEVNDTLGHATGDLVLKESASKISHCVRHNDQIARLGGDEFTVILRLDNTASDDIQVIGRICQQLLASLAQPMQFANKRVEISASIGAARYPQDAFDPESLLKQADTAMYTAKNSGRNCMYFAGQR